MANKTFATYLSELSAVTSLGAGDKLPVLESSTVKYVDGADVGGGGITALTGDVTASGTGSVAATIANSAVTNAKVATGIDAVKIADGSVTNAEFQYLGNVTSDIQTQLNAKQASDATLTAFAALTITSNSITIGTGADAFSQTAFVANTFPARASTGSLEQKTISDFGLSLVDDADASTARTTLGLGTLATQSGTFSGTSSGTNTGDQTITNSSDATSHTVTLSASGGSVQFVEGSGVTLTTTGTGSAGIVTIAASSGSGDITNGGNTTGAAVTIGTNDDFGLNLETSGVTRMAITGAASTGGAVTITNVTTNTNAVQDVLTIQTNSTGTAANGFGGKIVFQGESSTTDNRPMAGIATAWTTATDATRSSNLQLSCISSGTEFTVVTFTASGMTPLNSAFTIGGISNTLTIGGSSGGVVVSSTSTANISIHNTANSANSTAGIVFGNATSFTQTSGTRNYIENNSSFAPTSGTAVHNQLAFTGTFNQTGGANGITRGIYLNQTLTAVADFRAIEIAANEADAKGIYQTGSSTTNNFVGGTMFGSTSAPSAVAAIEVSSTTKGVLLPRMTTTERDAISAVAGLLIYNTTTGKLNIYTTAWEAVTSA